MQPVGEFGIHRSQHWNFREPEENGRGVCTGTDALKNNLNQPALTTRIKGDEAMSLAKRSEKGLLTPDNCVVALIDHQSQMLFGVTSIDRQTLINNVMGFAKATKAFGVPTILSKLGNQNSFSQS
jgi:hypothetical protein